MDVFESHESEVRSYCRGWPAVFQKASGSRLYDEEDNAFLDFFAGAGTLNYGHNHPLLKEKLLAYLADDNIVHSLDMYTVAKRRFLETFHEVVLAPRGLDYRVQFPGPAGTTAVEAALKLARKYTGRETIVSFTNAFHGMSLGALAVTGNGMKRGGAGIPLGHAVPMPFDNYLDGRTPDFLLFERLLEDSGSGLDAPAAVIVETVQGEGGLNAATPEWLRGLADVSPAPRDAAHRRRRSDGLRAHGTVLQLRAGRHRARHRLPVQVAERVRPAVRRDAAQTGTRRLGAR